MELSMENQIETQLKICKIQIWQTIACVVMSLLSVVISGLMWYAWELHPVLVVLIMMALFAVFLFLTDAIFSSAIKSLYKKLDKLLVVKLDESKLEKILAEITTAGVFNLTKQNYFLFFKNTIDNIAFYNANGATTIQELKGIHTKNKNNLKKSFPDISNQYNFTNHLSMDARVFVVDEMEDFLKEYITQDSNKLASIGKLRCAIEKNTASVVIPTLLPKGIGLYYLSYLKLINYFYKK